MKLSVLSAAALVRSADAVTKHVQSSAAELDGPQRRPHLHHLRAETQHKLGNLVAVDAPDKEAPVVFGNDNCPCIGFNGVKGATKVVLAQETHDIVVSYPVELGSSCKAWDDGNHPFCAVDGSKQDFCEQRWCYVNPKDCNLPVLPKLSVYQPKATFQTMPVYYSYDTCDSEDTYAKKHPKVGSSGCRCIGFKDAPGMTVANIGNGEKVEYPAALGGQCKAWDSGHHPDCVGEHQPDWCEKQWCFVDPCSCDAEVPPKVSAYLGDAAFQGKPVFWSYDTCGDTDTFSKKGDLAKSKKKKEDVCKVDAQKPKDQDIVGNSKCPCIGFDGVDGETIAAITHSGMEVEVSYPADLGGSCDSWDESFHPTCKGDSPASWCKEKWCYVDPRNCHIQVLPKRSTYQRDTRFQNMPLYYSYSTCGAKDMWNKDDHWEKVGLSGCRCIGIEGLPGTIATMIEGSRVDYPAEMGGECQAWDQKRHPSCSDKNGDKPSWCKKQWCYVDPCSCNLDVPPKTASFLGDATFQGRRIFWSYSTCGETDDYSTEAHRKESKKELNRLCSGEVPTKKDDSPGGRRRARSSAIALKPLYGTAAVSLALLMFLH